MYDDSPSTQKEILDWGCYGGNWSFHQINVYVIYMHVNFSWNFHQIFILTISFIVLNVSIDIVLIYRPHPVSRIVKAWIVFTSYNVGYTFVPKPLP